MRLLETIGRLLLHVLDVLSWDEVAKLRERVATLEAKVLALEGRAGSTPSG